MIGQTISHYTIIEKLGSGGMGVVYKAEDTTLKRTVALKFLPPELSFDPEAKERFLHEAQTASALQHANLCTVHDIGETPDGQMFICMDFYDGETLNATLRHSPLSIDRAVDIGIQICQGLSRAHEAGILHRDIKPANIMLTGRGEVKILDFGLAKLAGQTRLTRTGSTLGTPAYMSPEQARSEAVDRRSDLWSLGVVLYEMFSGRLPFPAENEQALLYAILHQMPPPLGELNTAISRPIEQIVQKALAKRQDERYQSADDLMADLKIIRGGEETAGVTLAGQLAKKSARRKTLLRVGLGTLAVAIGTAVYLYLSPVLQENARASNPATIAVISFDNQTGDRGQDHLRNVLQDAIITSLEQSKYFRVTTRERIADILKEIGKKDVEFLDRELGLEICRREGAAILMVGTFGKAGELYRTSVKLVDANTLQTLKAYTASGKGIESLLADQIDELSRSISRGFGISQRQTEATIRPINEVATSSTLAYQLYLRGQEHRQRINGAEARRYFEMAVKEDSLFISAWIDLDFACLMTGDGRAALNARKKAISLFDRGSEKERMRIAYFEKSLRAAVTGKTDVTDLAFDRYRVAKFPREKQFLWELGVDLEYTFRRWDDAIAVFKTILDLDPHFGPALNSLGYAYLNKGDTDKAIESMKHYIEAFPGDRNPRDSMGDVFFVAGKLDEAVACFVQAGILDTSTKSEEWFKIARAYFAREKYEDALRWSDSLMARAATPQEKASVLWHRAYCMHWLGRLSEAASLLRRREPLLQATGDRSDGFVEAWIACDRREFARSHSYLRRWISRRGKDSPGKYPWAESLAEFCLAYVDLREGKLESVEARLAIIDSIRNALPGDDSSEVAKWSSDQQASGCWTLRGELLIARGRAAEVPAALPESSRYKLLPSLIFPYGPGWCWESETWSTRIPLPADYLARAYAITAYPDSAIALYERELSQLKWFHEVYPRYHYRLALLYEQKGMKERAIAEYEKFLTIWGKADPVYREPADARARLARLKRG